MKAWLCAVGFVLLLGLCDWIAEGGAAVLTWVFG